MPGAYGILAHQSVGRAAARRLHPPVHQHVGHGHQPDLAQAAPLRSDPRFTPGRDGVQPRPADAVSERRTARQQRSPNSSHTRRPTAASSPSPSIRPRARPPLPSSSSTSARTSAWSKCLIGRPRRWHRTSQAASIQVLVSSIAAAHGRSSRRERFAASPSPREGFPGLPDLPSISEAVPGVVMNGWFAVVACRNAGGRRCQAQSGVMLVGSGGSMSQSNPASSFLRLRCWEQMANCR